MTVDNLLFAIRDTTEVSDAEVEEFLTQLDDDPTPRERGLLEACLVLNRPLLHFDLQNRLDLPCLPNLADDNEFYIALI